MLRPCRLHQAKISGELIQFLTKRSLRPNVYLRFMRRFIAKLKTVGPRRETKRAYRFEAPTDPAVQRSPYLRPMVPFSPASFCIQLFFTISASTESDVTTKEEDHRLPSVAK